MADQTPTPEASGTVNVINPSGALVSIHPDQLQEALGYGYREPSPDELHEATQKLEFGEGKGNELKAGALGFAGMASLGTVPYALSKSGIVPSEEQAALAKYNPNARMAGEGAGLLGAVAATVLTGGGVEAAGAGVAGAEALGAAAESVVAKRVASEGLKSLLNPISAVSKLGEAVGEAALPGAKKIAGKLVSESAHPVIHQILAQGGAKTVGSAVEGALFGVGGALDEAALGDPDALGEHLVSHVGLGMALGAGVGFAAGAAKGAGQAFAERGFLPKWLDRVGKAPEATQAAYRDAIEDATYSHMDDAPGIIPQSLGDIQDIVSQASAEGLAPGELPSKKLLSDSLKAVPDLKYPVNNIQLESLSDSRARDVYKTILENGGENGQALRSYEALQKQELTQKLAAEVGKLSPTQALTHDAIKGGDSLVDSFVESYQAEKKALAPLFKDLDSAGVKVIENPGELIGLAEKAIPGSKDLIQVTDDGFKLAKYKPSLPISKTAHEALSDIVKAANDKNLTLGGLRNVRESIRDRINWLVAPRESHQLSALGRETLNYIQDKLESSGVEVNARETFKRYAINEEKRGVIERIFGGSISDKATFAKQIKSEDVLNRLFSNTVSIQAAKDILPQDVFNKALGDWLSHQKASVTDLAKNGFSSAKFATFLKNKAPELSVALTDNPQALAKIQALTDIMRILPDSPSINPSGTAKTLSIMEKIRGLTALLNPFDAAEKFAGNKLKQLAEHLDKKGTEKVVNQMLSGKTFEEATKSANQKANTYRVMKYLEETYQKAKKSMEKGARDALKMTEETSHAAIFLEAKSGQSDKKQFEKMRDTMNHYALAPEKLIDHLDQTTRALHGIAPGTAASYQQTVARATGFLLSKVPKSAAAKPMSLKYEPSDAEIAQFNRYYQVVQNPLHVLKQIKAGTITSEAVETLETVYPKIYQEMQGEVMEAVTHSLGKGDLIPYPTKLSLSLFLKQDLDESMSTQHILDNQMLFMSQRQMNGMPQTGAPSRRKTDMGNITKAQALLTDMQATALRDEE